MAKYRIMIVDDDDDTLQVLEMMLRSQYEVVCARDGLDALNALDACEPDLFLLDVLMPVMDGFDTCVAIRRHPRYRDAHVIFLSCLNDQKSVRKMYELGGDFFIAKPFDANRLLRNLEISLKGKPSPRPKRFTIEEIKAGKAEPAVAEGAPEPTGDRKKPSKPSAKDAASARPDTPPRLMVVDDDEGIRLMLSEAFADRFEVAPAEDGQDAMARMLEIEPDVLLLDIMMPGIDGLEVCRSLRRITRFADLPIIFLSAFSSEKVRDAAKKAGGTGFVAKPCPLKDMKRILDAVVARPSFRAQPKRQTLEQLMGAKGANDARQQRQRSEQSVERDFGRLKKFVKTKLKRGPEDSGVQWED